MKKVAPHIDFADSSYNFCETKDENLIVYLHSWDDKTIKIIFFNAIKFIYRGGDFIEDLYIGEDKSSFLTEAISSYYTEIPIDQPFKTYLIMDISDGVVFEIIADNVLVTKE